MTLIIILAAYFIGILYVLFRLPHWIGEEGFVDILNNLSQYPNPRWTREYDISLMLIIGFLLVLLWPGFAIWFCADWIWCKVKGVE